MKNYDRVKDTEYGKFYYLGDDLHRLDGPAIEYENGGKLWYQNDSLHRLDGPAYEHADGSKEWYVDSLLHRLDGPAVEYADGARFWFINGEEYYFNDWLRLVWDDLPLEKKKGYIFGGFDEEL